MKIAGPENNLRGQFRGGRIFVPFGLDQFETPQDQGLARVQPNALA